MSARLRPSPRMPRLRPLAAAFAALALLAGCQLGPRPLAGAQAVPSGEWAVVDIRPGGGGVRDAGDAMARYGQTLRFGPDLAVSGGDSCTQPTYLGSLMVGDRYLHATLGLRAADLGLYRYQDLRITEVYCKGRKWRALGGEVAWVDDQHGYAVRDGVLYTLRRVGGPAR